MLIKDNIQIGIGNSVEFRIFLTWGHQLSEGTPKFPENRNEFGCRGGEGESLAPPRYANGNESCWLMTLMFSLNFNFNFNINILANTWSLLFEANHYSLFLVFDERSNILLDKIGHWSGVCNWHTTTMNIAIGRASFLELFNINTMEFSLN